MKAKVRTYTKICTSNRRPNLSTHALIDDSDDIAADVRFRDVDSLIGRLGVRLAKDWFRKNEKGETLGTNGWLSPSVCHEFKGKPKTEFSSADGFAPFEADFGGSWWEASPGVDYQAVSLELNTWVPSIIRNRETERLFLQACFDQCS
jgi:hypothetical protein